MEAQAALFREYIGAKFMKVKFTDVPINPNVEFHFILSFAIDYDSSATPSPTDGKFNIFWDSNNLSPSQVSSIKNSHSNVKVALSLKLITTLKRNKVISFASIAPFDDDQVQSHYLALWSKYGHQIDYVNFQFYAYDEGTTVSHFLNYFKTQSSKYNGGKVLASFSTDSSGGLKPNKGFFKACRRLKSQQQLHGIFVWSADDSKANGFQYEKQSQALLAV
ncbi:chitinase 2-like [Fagus crenata]